MLLLLLELQILLIELLVISVLFLLRPLRDKHDIGGAFLVGFLVLLLRLHHQLSLVDEGAVIATDELVAAAEELGAEVAPAMLGQLLRGVVCGVSLLLVLRV